MTAAVPWIVLSREDLDAVIDRAIARAKESGESQWMSVEAVAEMLDVERRTVLGYIKREKLPCRYAGKSPVFRRDEVARWLDDRTSAPRARRRR
jgi:excisionase family DNA binding protein